MSRPRICDPCQPISNRLKSRLYSEQQGRGAETETWKTSRRCWTLTSPPSFWRQLTSLHQPGQIFCSLLIFDWPKSVELCGTVVTGEITLFSNNYEIMPVIYFTCNHVWNWNNIISAAKKLWYYFIIINTATLKWTYAGKCSWAAPSLWNIFWNNFYTSFHTMK